MRFCPASSPSLPHATTSASAPAASSAASPPFPPCQLVVSLTGTRLTIRLAASRSLASQGSGAAWLWVNHSLASPVQASISAGVRSDSQSSEPQRWYRALSDWSRCGSVSRHLAIRAWFRSRSRLSLSSSSSVGSLPCVWCCWRAASREASASPGKASGHGLSSSSGSDTYALSISCCRDFHLA